MRIGFGHVVIVLILAATILAACGPVDSGGSEKTIYVGPELVDCEGVAPQTCMQVKENPGDPWTFFYDQIDGFGYQEGYEYELLIKEEEVKDAPADASSIKWSLVKVVSKTKVPASGSVAALEGVTWTLDSYLDSTGQTVKLLPDSEITAQFQAGEVRGNAGCNSYFGSYELQGGNLTVGPLGMTEMYCMPDELMTQESDYLAALQSAASFEIVNGRLQINNGDAQVVLTFAPQESTPLTGALWQLTGYNNGKGGVVSVLQGTEITAIFDEEGNLSGSAGCNNYATSYETDGDQITTGPVAATMMMCAEPEGVMEQEAAYLTALESAATYQIEGQTLSMYKAEGERALTFTQVEPTPLVDTLWQLTGYDNGTGGFASVLADTEITAIFGQDGKLSGSSGCNNYATTYETDGDQINTGLAASTMMMCGAPQGIMEQENAYLAALASANTYQVQGQELTILNAEGQRALTYTEQEPAPLVETPWQLVSYNNGREAIVSVLIDTEITALFGPDGNLSGSAGCNNYTAAYQLDGSAISIGPAATTRKMCPGPEGIMKQEAEYLAALAMATNYQIEGDSLSLRESEGRIVAQYVIQAEPTGLDDEALMNMEYQSEWTQSGTAPLVDGEYSEQAAPGSATMTTVALLPEHTVTGQLNGQDVAVVVLATNPGGSGTFLDLAVVADQDGQPVHIATTSLGDRAQINSVTIEENQIVVDMITHGPDDPMCCPTQRTVQSYALQGDQLVETGSRTIDPGTETRPDLTGVVWKWEKFLEANDNTILVPNPEQYTIEFLANGQLQIRADCNSVGGSYTVDDNALSIELGPTTLAACPPGSLADEYLSLLQDVSSYVMDGDNLALAVKYDTGILEFAPSN